MLDIQYIKLITCTRSIRCTFKQEQLSTALVSLTTHLPLLPIPSRASGKTERVV